MATQWPARWHTNSALAAVDEVTDQVWPLNDLASARVPPYPIAHFTLAPQGWVPIGPRITQQEYNERFAREFPQLMKCLPCPGIMVCGDAAAFPLGDALHHTTGIDFKIICLGAKDGLSYLNQFVARLRTTYKESQEELVVPGLINFKPLLEPQMQIVLRTYASPADALNDSDLPCAKICFDGEITYLTADGAFAHVYRVNNLSRPVLGFESRVAKHFRHGFAVAIPNFDETGAQIPTLGIQLGSQVGHVSYGILTSQPEPEIQSHSEPMNSNIAAMVLRMQGMRSRMRIASQHTYTGYMSHIHMLKSADIRDTIESIRKRPLTFQILALLQDLVGLSDHQVADLARDVLHGFRAGADQVMLQPKTLETDIQKLVDFNDQHGGERYSIWELRSQPIYVDLKKWLGPAYVSDPQHADVDPTILLVDLVANARKRIIESCPLCLEPILAASPGTAVLPCGHLLHWHTEQCGGLYQIVHMYGNAATCPMCRAQCCMSPVLPEPAKRVVLI